MHPRRALIAALAATAASGGPAQAAPTARAGRAATAPDHGHLFAPAPRSVRFEQGVMPGDPDGANYAASADVDNGIIYVNGQMPRSTKAHEVGHLFDKQVLTDGDRHFFMRLMGTSGAWDQGTGYSGLKSPKELFADWYGNAVNQHDGVHRWDSAYADTPDPKQFQKFREALARLGRRQGLSAYQR